MGKGSVGSRLPAPSIHLHLRGLASDVTSTGQGREVCVHVFACVMWTRAHRGMGGTWDSCSQSAVPSRAMSLLSPVVFTA